MHVRIHCLHRKSSLTKTGKRARYTSVEQKSFLHITAFLAYLEVLSGDADVNSNRKCSFLNVRDIAHSQLCLPFL